MFGATIAGSAAKAEAHRLSLRVEHAPEPLGGGARRPSARRARGRPRAAASGDDADAGALSEVDELLDELVDLGRSTSGPRSLISVCSLVVGSMMRGWSATHPRSCEVVEDGLLGEELEDPRARRPAREPRRDHRAPQELQGARDVHPLAAGDGPRLDRPVPAAGRKFGTATVRSIAAFNVTVRITVDASGPSPPLDVRDDLRAPAEASPRASRQRRANEYHDRHQADANDPDDDARTGEHVVDIRDRRGRGRRLHSTPRHDGHAADRLPGQPRLGDSHLLAAMDRRLDRFRARARSRRCSARGERSRSARPAPRAERSRRRSGRGRMRAARPAARPASCCRARTRSRGASACRCRGRGCLERPSRQRAGSPPSLSPTPRARCRHRACSPS